ncbi:hypothetical protein EXU57_00880 [Segetibacter sp. 3557_3]|uniref:DUF5689 domain-containing protein n=1 Tax=Segetibacter sp. 3557_3 TaxID=2547429 RepID=UPI0010588CD1|nr:DUF5689 domain-containing protein [Segetibacter sp. 3557_3]TDH28664.1 hypothetical protein EXU57_00880 [Segetibacter sp. 3557_3]
MKFLLRYSSFLLVLAFFWGCEKYNYPGGRVSPYISIFDVKELYKGEDVSLRPENMYGSTQITAMVVSDHSGGNMPAGLLIVQEARRLNELRGIAIDIGADAAKYVPGDSVTITVAGGVLTRVNGMQQIKGVPASAVTKVASGVAIPANRVPSNLILANPEKYENTLVVIVKGGFNPLPSPTDVLSGDKTLNDGFGNLTLHTEPTASFANSKLSFNSNYYGIVFNTMMPDKTLKPELRVRNLNDIVVLSSTVEVQSVLITGFMPDVEGGDGNYEYIQLMATRDINFAATPFAVVVTNNANTATPTGAPVNGWGTGGQRTYKFNLTSGTAAKGSFFYVGGSTKLINGASSTSMAASNWIRSFNYSTTAGDDGVGNATSGLFANSGNASGIAVFEETAVSLASKPIDVMFVATGGSLFLGERGYRVANNDWYDVKNPVTLQDQPFYRMGSNTLNLSYPAGDQGMFNKLGGEYNPVLGRWMKARTQTFVDLSKSSPLTEIEGEGATKLVQ